MNKKQLAEKLGISRTTLHGYLARTGAPQPDEKGQYGLPEVQEWAAKCAAQAAAGNATLEGSELDELRAKRMRLQTETMELEFRRQKGELIPVSQVAPTIAAFNAELTANLRQKFEIELPQKYRGKGTVECQQLNAAAVDEILGRLKAGQWALGIPKEPR